MPVDVLLDVGSKRVFASALDWPGWSRGGRTKEEALEELHRYAPRYAKVIKDVRRFTVPRDLKSFNVVEEVKGTTTTDFGVPAVPSQRDGDPLTTAQLDFLLSALDASFSALDSAAKRAKGKTLTKGPRGGGRSLEKIVEHVWEANYSYLVALAGRENLTKDLEGPKIRKAMKEALAAGARGELPSEGPRGGQRWAPRYFVRRAAWHILDHIWEIEDRSGTG